MKYQLYSSEDFVDCNIKETIYKYIKHRDNILIYGEANTGKTQVVLSLLYEYFYGNIDKYVSINTKEDFKKIQYHVSNISIKNHIKY